LVLTFGSVFRVVVRNETSEFEGVGWAGELPEQVRSTLQVVARAQGLQGEGLETNMCFIRALFL